MLGYLAMEKNHSPTTLEERCDPSLQVPGETGLSMTDRRWTVTSPCPFSCEETEKDETVGLLKPVQWTTEIRSL